jgi:hypothetical protein
VDAAGVGGPGGPGSAEPGRLEHRPGHRALTGTQRNRASRCATSSVVGACGRARRPAFVLIAPPRGGYLPEIWPAAVDRLGSSGSRLVHLCPPLSPARIRARSGSGAPILGRPAGSPPPPRPRCFGATPPSSEDLTWRGASGDDEVTRPYRAVAALVLVHHLRVREVSTSARPLRTCSSPRPGTTNPQAPPDQAGSCTPPGSPPGSSGVGSIGAGGSGSGASGSSSAGSSGTGSLGSISRSGSGNGSTMR